MKISIEKLKEIILKSGFIKPEDLENAGKKALERSKDLGDILKIFGFAMRVRGSHHIFRKQGIIEKINLQQDGNKAKPYQVKQVRNIIIKYQLGGKI